MLDNFLKALYRSCHPECYVGRRQKSYATINPSWGRGGRESQRGFIIPDSLIHKLRVVSYGGVHGIIYPNVFEHRHQSLNIRFDAVFAPTVVGI